MRRWGLTLIELLVVIAIISALVALLVPAVQKVRETANRARCQNNLKQIALASHSYHGVFDRFPPGATTAPSHASALALLLPYLEQANLYQQFDFSKSAFGDPANAAARAQQVVTFLCPSDPSRGYYEDLPPPGVISGKSNYFANMGAHGWSWDQFAPLQSKPAALTGVFAFDSRTRIGDIKDGSSNTVLFAEVKRGARPDHDDLDVTVLLPPVWDNRPYNPATNPNNLRPPAACNEPVTTLNDTGLEYYRGFLNTAFYVHTIPPNSRERDCIRGLLFDQGHVAARSYHAGGVNVALADGSVRFISDTIRSTVWHSLGTRSGGDVVDPGGF